MVSFAVTLEALFILYRTKAISYTVISNGKEVEQVVHKHPTSCSSVWPRGGLVNKIPVLTPKYLLPSQWIPVLPAPTYSLPLRSLIPVHITPKAWHRTYPICTASISRSGRRSFAPSWKSRQNRCSHVLTEGLSGLVFAQVQGDLFGKI